MSNLSKNLKLLLAQNKLSENELARRTGLPQQMINAINSGKNQNPKLSSLLPIVKFFSISLSQLIGDENLAGSLIPYLGWKQLKPDLADPLILTQKMSVTDLPNKGNLFALNMHDDSMEPRFPKNTSLIFDKSRKAENASFVLVYRANEEKFSFRMLIAKKSRFYIKALNPKSKDSKITELTENDKILAVLVQSKTNHADY